MQQYSKKYYQLDTIISTYPKTFIGCRTKKDFVKKHKLEYKTDYKFFRFDNKIKKFIQSDGKSRKFDKIFIRIKSFHDKFDNSEYIIDNENDYLDVPDFIELEEHEKFKDEDNNNLNIEVRGKRNVFSCFFRVKDISNAFGIPNLRITLVNEHSGYEINVHYVYFYDVTKDDGVKIKKLYLTYLGVLRVLFVSKTKISQHFISWATHTLFTAQFGTTKSRIELAAEIIHSNVDEIKSVISKSSMPISCVYYFTLGTVKDLRESFNIPEKYHDDMILSKYGMTKNLNKRTQQHHRTYSKFKGVNLSLAYFSIIDPEYISEAENCLSITCNLSKNKLEKHKELVILEPEDIKEIKKLFNNINSIYCIRHSNLSALIKDEQHKFNMLELKMENQLLKKENEILKLKNEIELLKLKNGVN